MRIFPASHSSGSALLLTVVSSGVLAFAVGSYLTLARSQHYATMRSLSWNASMPVLEAGVEEALSQIHVNGTNRLANNGWTLQDGRYFMKERSLGDERYVVGISDTDPPVIVSEGFVRAPLSTNLISRSVRVTTRLQTMFPRGMVADREIDLNGREVTIDSFDSGDPNYSNGGLYDPARAKDNGSVVTNSQLTDALDAGNATIKGTVSTGPGGSVEIGPTGVVGDAAYAAKKANQGTIQPGHLMDDTSIDLPPVEVPYTSGFAPSSGSWGGTNGYNFILQGQDYVISGRTVFGGKVIVTGHARVVVTSEIQFSGLDFIYIMPGASLKVYADCEDASLGGLGVVNGTGLAENFQFLGTPRNTDLAFSGNAHFVGTIYAPNADFTLGGGGKNTYDFSGASVSRTVTMNGKFNFHYDERLATRGPHWGYIPTGWQEVRQTWKEIRAGGLDLTRLTGL